MNRLTMSSRPPHSFNMCTQSGHVQHIHTDTRHDTIEAQLRVVRGLSKIHYTHT